MAFRKRGNIRPMKDFAYEMREAAEFHNQMMSADKAPLHERKAACAEFLEAMKDPELVAERIGWLLDGNYGYGSMQAAKRAIANKRANRPALLTHLIGTLEWQCPARMAAGAWKKLTKEEQAALDKAVKAAIRQAEAAE